MIENEMCRVCGKLAILEETVRMRSGLIGIAERPRSKWKFYCSKTCRDTEIWKKEAVLGILLTIFMMTTLYFSLSLDNFSSLGLLALFGISISLFPIISAIRRRSRVMQKNSEFE